MIFYASLSTHRNEKQIENMDDAIKRERIAKVIAHSGVCSRRMAEKWIGQARIKVNHITINSPATLVSSSDCIEIDDVPLSVKPIVRVWLYYKPVGLITSHFDPENRETVFNFLKQQGLPHVISVGRLDINSEGLLIITNSPSFAHQMESPKNLLPRTYQVRVFGKLNPEKLFRLKYGITIHGIEYKPIIVKILKKNDSLNHWLELTLYEGKNREIRKIMEYFDLKVNRLIRISFGDFSLGDLKPGEVVEIK